MEIQLDTVIPPPGNHAPFLQPRFFFWDRINAMIIVFLLLRK